MKVSRSMTPEQLARVHVLVARAADKAPEARSGFLARECADDAAVRREVERLLASDGRPIAGDADGEAPTEPFADPERTVELRRPAPSRQLGAYRLLHKLGEGGMGEVWAARQERPIRRQVAVKIVKRGMDTAELLRRFEAERQALALMDHPAIARVYEAGETPRGRPYFAMESVAGVPITDYCDARRLTTRQRLGLFLEVCAGVRHAHQKAILHRDLKPSNVLVAEQDGRPAPKIIDFGLAKALAQPLTERTLYTAMGELVGTPAYMSPEQVELSGLDVDTRTDVYSLGVMLYELLVGERPFDGRRLRSAGFDELRRIIREDAPPRPSTRLQTPGEPSTRSAHKRRTDPRTLAGQLSGDLDWITMKALEKERARRYGSVDELAADIRRYLENEPVLARPPSAVYRLRKFVRRNRLRVVAATVPLVLLVAFAVASSFQAQRLARERDRANREAAAAQEVSDFLTQLFNVSKPGENLGDTITARELLDRGAERVAAELGDQPATQGRLMATIGEVYRQLGHFDQATELLEGALELQRSALGADHPRTLRTLSDLAHLARNRGRYDEAVGLYEPLIAALEGREEDPVALARALNDLASVRIHRGELAEAATMLDRASAAFEAALGAEHPNVATVLNNLGAVQMRRGLRDEAAASFRRSLAIREAALPADHPDLAYSFNNLAFVYQSQGRPAEAVPLYRRALSIREKSLGGDHPNVATVLHNLAGILDELGESQEAERLGRRALAIREGALGPEHRDVAVSLGRLGRIHHKRGELAAARPLYQRTLAILEASLGPDHLQLAEILVALAEIEAEVGDRGAALERYGRAESICRSVLAEEPGLPEALHRSATIQLAVGDLYAADGLGEPARQAWLEASTITAPFAANGDRRDLAEAHVEALLRLGRRDEAERYRAALDAPPDAG